MHGAVEVAHLAAQVVDPLHGRDRAREHELLDLLDVALELDDDGRVVVDDLVEDRPQRRRRALAQERRARLQAEPRPVQVARRALAHRDHEGRAEEDRDLAELDLLALRDVPRGPQDHEGDALVVLLDLRAQVEALRVLHRELVQPEDALQALELLGRRIDHAEPHEAGVAAADRGGVLGPHRPFLLPAPIVVVGAVDDHRTGIFTPRRGDAATLLTGSLTKPPGLPSVGRKSDPPRACRSSLPRPASPPVPRPPRCAAACGRTWSPSCRPRRPPWPPGASRSCCCRPTARRSRRSRRSSASAPPTASAAAARSS